MIAIGDSIVATTYMHNGLSDDGMGGYDARPGDVLKVVGFPDGPSIWDLRVEDAHGHRFLCATHEVKPHNAPGEPRRTDR